MSPGKILTIGYFADLGMKAAIAIVMGICGWGFKDMKEAQNTLLHADAEKSSRIAVLEASYITVVKQLDRIENKVDRGFSYQK